MKTIREALNDKYGVDGATIAESIVFSSREAVYESVGSMGGVQFDNKAGLTLTTEDGLNFVVEGELNTMTEAQSLAFWGSADYVNSQFVVVFINAISADNPVVQQGWVNDKDSTDYKDPKSGSTAKGKILAITMGDTLRADLEGCYIWKCELTDGSVYTVDLTAQAAAVGA